MPRRFVRAPASTAPENWTACTLLTMRDNLRMLRCVIALAIVAVAGASARGEADLERLIEEFTSGPRETRIEAARRLVRLGPDAAPTVPALIRTLEDDDPDALSFQYEGVVAGTMTTGTVNGTYFRNGADILLNNNEIYELA